jgi:hypothetical protein
LTDFEYKLNSSFPREREGDGRDGEGEGDGWKDGREGLEKREKVKKCAHRFIMRRDTFHIF